MRRECCAELGDETTLSQFCVSHAELSVCC